MNIDYWEKFTKSGKVEDYLHYRESVCCADSSVNYVKPDQDGKRSSAERDKNKGKRQNNNRFNK